MTEHLRAEEDVAAGSAAPDGSAAPGPGATLSPAADPDPVAGADAPVQSSSGPASSMTAGHVVEHRAEQVDEGTDGGPNSERIGDQASGDAHPGRPAGGQPAGDRPAGGRPGRRPGGRPPVVPVTRGGPNRPGATPAVAAAPPTAERTDPAKWGRIDEAGVVYVFGAQGERAIGSWQAGDAAAGLAHFARRFDDFATEITLLETRLATGSGDPKAARAHAVELRESVDTLAGIGDLDSAAARLEIVIAVAEAAIAGASTARAAARAAAVAAKEALCVEAEELAESEQWKATGDRLREIVEQWRTIRGVDRKTDDALWKRFAKARDTFARRRGTHFADLDKQRGATKEAKEALVARAEALSDSTEFGSTAGQYRVLMEEWKASGRAPREIEDALWERFRAAQEKFFSHRNRTMSERDQEFETNAAIKDALLAEAEKINPAAGLDAAKAAFRTLVERWEATGKVPRERIKEFESRLRAVEVRISSAEDSHRRWTDPETMARIEQFRSRADFHRAQAAKARAAGNAGKAQQAEAQAAQWEEWLAAAQGAVDR